MNAHVPIGPTSVFLVSGGARGITARCVIRMAEVFRCGFILLGRTPVSEPEPPWARGCDGEADLKKQMVVFCRARGLKPAPREIQTTCGRIMGRREVEGTLWAVRRAGGRAVYVCADVTDGQTLEGKLAAQEMGPVTGLIHGAGNLADRRIEDKTERDFETVYTTKVTGLQNLFACLPPDQLDHLVLFSSAAGFYGNVGQTDYALANEILNKIAHRVKRRHPSCCVFSFNWGPWDGGMVTPGLKHLFARRRIRLIPVETGAQVLVNGLQSGGPVQMVVGSAFAPPNTVASPTLKTHRIRRKLTLAANPFLQDHVVGGVAVLPTVCAISWIGRACEQRYPGFRFFKCRDFRVLKGIVFDQTLAGEYVLDLKETGETHADEVVLDARIWSENQTGRVQYHYSARFSLRPHLPEPPVCAFDPTAFGEERAAVSCYRDGTLFHGPTFQGVREVLELRSDRLTMACKIPQIDDRRQGQFQVYTFNPYAADVQFQSMVIWARQVYGAGSLPLACRWGEQFGTVPFDRTFYVSMEVASATEAGLVANILTHDERGRIYNRISGAEVTISKGLNPLFLQNQPSTQRHKKG